MLPFSSSSECPTHWKRRMAAKAEQAKGPPTNTAHLEFCLLLLQPPLQLRQRRVLGLGLGQLLQRSGAVDSGSAHVHSSRDRKRSTNKTMPAFCLTGPRGNVQGQSAPAWCVWTLSMFTPFRHHAMPQLC